MSLNFFESYLVFAEGVSKQRSVIPDAIDVIELESALTCHGVVLLHSQMEQCVRNAVSVRCLRIADPKAQSFAQSIISEKTNKVGIESLNQTLNRFGKEYKEFFQKCLKESGLNAAWDSVVNHRRKVAHDGIPATLSLADLRSYYDGIRRVLGFYCKALELTDQEIQSISPLVIVPR
jgi:hypothetical protein